MLKEMLNNFLKWSVMMDDPLKVTFIIQTLMWLIILMDVAIGLRFLLIRQIVGFIYLILVPGFLILRILNISKISENEKILYSIGLSVASLMFIGLFMNTFLPFLGVLKPISTIPLMITITCFILFFCFLNYAKYRAAPKKSDTYTYFSNSKLRKELRVSLHSLLLLSFIPFLSIFGTYLVNFHGNNILLISLILLLAMIVVLTTFSKNIPHNSLTIFILAISILYHNSLISKYLWGFDVQVEWYLSSLVETSGWWNSTVMYIYNTVLSTNMLGPIFSEVCNMELLWFFKIICPFLFSLVPVGLFSIFQKQTNSKIAFLSCFYFIALSTFYREAVQTAKQQIAMLFLTLLVLLMVNESIERTKKSILCIIFGISLVVSSYSISYICGFLFILTCLVENVLYALKKKLFNKKNWNNYPNYGNKAIGLTYTLLYTISILAWYIYTSNSYTFTEIVLIGHYIVNSIFTEFLNPRSIEVAQAILREKSILYKINQYLYIISQFFIMVGILNQLLKKKEEKTKFTEKYFSFSLSNIFVLLLSLIVPYFSGTINVTRLYQITLITLAPFCVMGYLTIVKAFSRIINPTHARLHRKGDVALKIFSIYLAIFFLFQSGFIYWVGNDVPSSISLSSSIDYPVFNEREICGANWLRSVKSENFLIYADAVRIYLFPNLIITNNIETFSSNLVRVMDNSYIYFGTLNVLEEKIVYWQELGGSHRISVIREIRYMNLGNITRIAHGKIYDNGGSQVYIITYTYKSEGAL
jgi:uncharacterized membrane protein